VDTIKKGKNNGTYDLLTKADLDAIIEGKSPVGSGKQEEKPKEVKDQLAGTTTAVGEQDNSRQVIEHYGRFITQERLQLAIVPLKKLHSG